MSQHLSIPSNWPAPKFSFGQLVEVYGYRGHIVGIEFQDQNHYFVRCEGYEFGWAYTIQCDNSKTDPLVTYDESEITLLTPALAA